MTTTTETTTRRGFKVTCPFCTDEDAVLYINLGDISVVHCPNCDREFTATEARDKLLRELTKWDRLNAWIKAAPEVGE